MRFCPYCGKRLLIDSFKYCPECGSSLSKSSDSNKLKTCNACGGTGQIKIISKTIFGEMVDIKKCKKCGGTGKITTESSNRP